MTKEPGYSGLCSVLYFYKGLENEQGELVLWIHDSPHPTASLCLGTVLLHGSLEFLHLRFF